MRRRSHALVILEAAVLAGLARAAQRVRAGPVAGPARAVTKPAVVAPLDRLRSNTCPAGKDPASLPAGGVYRAQIMQTV